MLTRSHLAVIGAALRFFREEMTPHGAAAMRPYFDEPPDAWPTAEELDRLSGLLRRCAVRYAACDPASARLCRRTLFADPSEAAAAGGSGTSAAAVLIPPVA